MVNISSYSAEVVNGNWAPAILAALADLPNGGTIVIDADVTTTSPVVDTSTNYINITFQGDGQHIMRIRPGIANYGLAFANKAIITYRDLVFIGYPNTETPSEECYSLIGGGFADMVIVDNCLFAGVYASRGIVDLGTTMGIVTRTKFGGCGGIHILSDASFSLSVRDVACIDYQNYRGIYYDRQGSRDAWVRVQNAAVNATVDILNFRGDEGAARQIDIDGAAQVILQHVACNLGSGEGINLTNVLNGIVTNAQFGWTIFDKPTLNIRTCGDITVDGMRGMSGPRSITTDRQSRVTLRNSPSVYLTYV